MLLKSLKRQCYFLLFLSVFLVGVFVQKSFASCTKSTYVLNGGGCSCNNSCDCSVTWAQNYCLDPCSAVSSSYCFKVGEKFCSSGMPRVSYYTCSSQEELDSLRCELDPNASGCFTAKDTTTYGCRDITEQTASGQVQYHLAVKFFGKTTQNGGVEWTDYEEKEKAPMSCADVGYCNYGQTQCTGDLNGWFGDDSGSSSSSSFDWGSSSSVSCKQTGQFGNNCYFECDNGAVGVCQGNDFNCDVVSDCDWQMQSSASDSPNSSASGQSASSENPDLQAIIENQNTQIEQLNYNNERLDSIKGRLGLLNGKTDASNALLSQIANNIGKIDNKTSIITNNTYNGGETIDYTDALNALGDSLGGIGSRLDKMLSGDSASLDSFTFDIGIDSLLDTSYTTYGDSLEGAYNSFAETYHGLVSDTGAIGRYTDSLAQLQKKFNFSPLGGSGTGCPSFLTKTYEINFIGNAKATFDLNKLGLCTPIIGNRAPWDLARALLRIIVAVSCMWFLFKCATSSGDNE